MGTRHWAFFLMDKMGSENTFCYLNVAGDSNEPFSPKFQGQTHSKVTGLSSLHRFGCLDSTEVSNNYYTKKQHIGVPQGKASKMEEAERECGSALLCSPCLLPASQWVFLLHLLSSGPPARGNLHLQPLCGS